MSFSVKVFAAWCSCGNSKCGAGLPMSGEGTSRGLSVSPTASSAISAAKTARGSTKRFMVTFSGSSGGGGRRRVLLLRSPRRDPVAPVARGDRAAERHEKASSPDPVDERLVLHAHDPGRRADCIAERHVQVAREAGIDRGFRHRHVLHRVDAFLGIKSSDCAPVLVDLNLGASSDVIRALHVPHAVEAERVVAELYGVARLHAHVALAATHAASSSPNATSALQRPIANGSTSPAAGLAAKAQRRRVARSGMLAFFQRASGPTEILPRPDASSASG